MNSNSRFAVLLLLSLSTFLALSLYFGTLNRNNGEREVKGTPIITLSASEDRETEIILTGDIMLGRTTELKSVGRSDFAYPFREVYGILQDADIVFANLESPIIEKCPPHESGYKFCANPEMLEGLVLSGIDVVTLANNHSLDYGKEGLSQTISNLNKHGIKATGVGSLEVIKRNNTIFGFLGFDFVSRQPTRKDYDLVMDSDAKADILIVGVHWGEEYKAKHNRFQRLWAEKLVESGADVIVGHHPHWVQDIEEIQGVPVFYSLGNFVFDQMWSEETKRGVIVKLTFTGHELTDQQTLKTYLSSWAQPVIMASE